MGSLPRPRAALVALAVAAACAPGVHAGLSIVPGPNSASGTSVGGALGDGGLAGCYHESGGPAFADHGSVNFAPGATRPGDCSTSSGITTCWQFVCAAGLPGSWFEQVTPVSGADT